MYTALATLESDCAFRPATAYCVCEVVTVKSPQTVELATQFVPELVVMAVPVEHPVPAPFVTGGFVVPWQITVPAVVETVTTIGVVDVPLLGVNVGVTATIPMPESTAVFGEAPSAPE